VCMAGSDAVRDESFVCPRSTDYVFRELENCRLGYAIRDGREGYVAMLDLGW